VNTLTGIGRGAVHAGPIHVSICDIMNQSHETWCLPEGVTPECGEVWFHGEFCMGGSDPAHYTTPVSDSHYYSIFASDQDLQIHSYLSSVAVIIPAFNEGRIIGTVVSQARKYASRIIVIDDGSSDDTAQKAAESGADVIRLTENQGKAGAVMAGCSYAQRLGYETIIMLDGDGQHDPNEIPVVAAPVMTGAADMVIGSRFLGEKSTIPLYRVAGQQVLNGFTRLASQAPITDSQSGFRVLGKRALENLDFNSKGYNLESDMITHFARLGIRMTEIPITVRYDVPNKHKMNPLMHGAGIVTHLLYDITRKSQVLSKVPAMTTLIFGAAIFFAFLSGLLFRPSFGLHLFSIGLFTMIMGSYSLVYSLIQKNKDIE